MTRKLPRWRAGVWWGDPSTGRIYCWAPQDKPDCWVYSLISPKTPTIFHDADLKLATSKINKILQNIETKNKKNGKRLSFIATPKGLMLAWMEEGVPSIKSTDEPSVINKALGI